MADIGSSIAVGMKPMRDYLVALFVKNGATAADAADVADHMIEASLAGHDSHGIMRGPEYLERVESGLIDVKARPEVAAEGESWANVDGHWGFGQPCSRFAMEIAIAKARTGGIGCVTVRNSNHMGRVGYYTKMAAAQSMVGIGCVNINGVTPMVAPFGGIDRRLGTNPFSVAFPTDREPAFMADFTTCAAAEGKVRWHRNHNEPTPEGWLIDHEGQATSDPWQFYREPLGALLPIGGSVAYKGYGLSMMVEALAGGLSGGGVTNPGSGRHGNACWYLAIDIGRMTPLAEFKAKIGAMIDYMKSSRRRPGGSEILYPGEPEFRSRQRRLADGIPVDPVTWNELAGWAKKVDITPPETLA
jgi:LDH2 family malate/lactate/ureidoglycolate dehydrogenase